MESFWDIINVPLGWLIKLCYDIIPNYAVSLIIFALMIKILLLPLSLKQHKNSLKQASLRPREAAIVKKYKNRTDRNSQQKKQEEIQRLYQAENYNQFAGCLPLLIQFPLIICIFNIVKSPLRYLCGLGSDVVKLITDKAGTVDQIQALNALRADFGAYSPLHESIAALDPSGLPSFSIFGVDLASTPADGVAWLLIIPVLNFLATFFSTKVIRKLSYKSPQMESQDASSTASLKIMEFTMPLLTTFIAYNTPGVIGIYWIYQSILGILQQFLLVKWKPYPVFTEEDYKDAERLMMGKPLKKKKKIQGEEKDPNRPRVRSLHHIDDDEYNAKVVESEEQKKARSENKDGVSGDGMLSPFPMKDYSDKKTNK